QGIGAPIDVHPSQLQKHGATKANHGQRLPYLSKDLAHHPERAETLRNILAPLSQFISDQMARLIPDEFEVLQEYLYHLPLFMETPCYPFMGCVVNFCVSTSAHTDPCDKLICVVVPFGDFQGGEICLYEPGLVFSLQPGEILMFPSYKITHFNLHFKGTRGSFVFSSDKGMDSFVDGSNGWEGFIHKHSGDSPPPVISA
ncbi:hypothetical protein BDN72DRAFT_760990, partial [Pluteus cervinus]